MKQCDFLISCLDQKLKPKAAFIVYPVLFFLLGRECIAALKCIFFLKNYSSSKWINNNKQ